VLISNEEDINPENSEQNNKSPEINISKQDDIVPLNQNKSYSLIKDVNYPRRINDFEYKAGRRTYLKRNDNFLKEIVQRNIKRNTVDGSYFKWKISMRDLYKKYSLNLTKEEILNLPIKDIKGKKHTKCISAVVINDTIENTSVLENLGLNTLNTIENFNYNCDSHRTVPANNNTDRIKLTIENETEFKNNFMKNISFFSKKNGNNPKQRNKKKLFQDTYSTFNNTSNLTPSKGFNVSTNQVIKNEKHLRISSMPFIEKSCLTSVREEVVTDAISKSAKKKRNKTKELHNMTFTKSKNFLNKSINNQYNTDIKVKKTINSSLSISPRKTKKSETKSPHKLLSAEKTTPSSPRKKLITFNRVASKPSFKNYTGPIDISCCISVEPNILLTKIGVILKKNKLVYFNSFKKYQCNKNGIKFLIEVMTLRESNISYIKLKKSQGSNLEYNQMISKLLKEFRNFK